MTTDKIKLRWYQQQIVDGIYKYWRKGLKRLLVFSCTRSGKTYLFSYMAKRANEKGNKVLILTNRKKLFKQTGNAIHDFDIKPYLINADNKTVRHDYMTYLAMSQTLERRLNKPEIIKLIESIQLVVIDECHISSFDKILNNPLFKDKFLIGVTGSPIRSGSMPELIDTYQQIVIGPYTVELEPEYCVPARVFEVPIDMTGISKDNKGEFNQYETFQRFDSAKIYQGAVNNWKKYANGLTTIVYCVSILHAAKTCVEFNKAGVKCKFISSGKMKPKLSENPNKGAITKHRIAMEEWQFIQDHKHLTGDPEKVIQEWERGDFQMLINVDMLTFGYDNHKIKCVLFNRATNSVPMFLQAANRGGTPYEGKKEFILLDMGGNSERLGDYNKKHEWSLVHKKPVGGGIPSTKECTKCQALIFSSARVCDYCGTEQPKSKEQKEVELVERKMSGKYYKQAIQEFQKIEDIEMLARVKKYSKMWVFRTVFYNLGEKEFKDYMRSKNYKWAYIHRLIESYN